MLKGIGKPYAIGYLLLCEYEDESREARGGFVFFSSI
jgi:hypothetical protein